MQPHNAAALGDSEELSVPRNLQPTLVRGVFGVFLSMLAIGGAAAHAIVNGLDAEAGVVQCNAVTRASVTLPDAPVIDAS